MHPIHISLTNIDYNENNNSFKVTIKIFKDDFETVIERKYNTEFDVNSEFNSETIKHINKYVKEHFILFVDNKKIDVSNIKLLKKKTNFEAIWLFYEIEGIQDFKKIRLKSSFLNDLYPDQKNLVIFNYKNINKGLQFKRNDEIAEVNI